jgi:hypothetical protein
LLEIKIFEPQPGDQFYAFLNHNFERHYDSNRAPLGLYFHAAWLKNNPEFLEAFLYWIDEVLANHNDVYFVTMTQVIQWIQNPRQSSEIKNFDPWKEKCSVDPNSPPACWVPNDCKLTSKEVPSESLNLQTCVRCPNNFPWLLDPEVKNYYNF